MGLPIFRLRFCDFLLQATKNFQPAEATVHSDLPQDTHFESAVHVPARSHNCVPDASEENNIPAESIKDTGSQLRAGAPFYFLGP